MDLGYSLTFGLGDEEEYEYGTKDHETGEEPEATVDADGYLHDGEAERDHEDQHPVGNDRDTSGSSTVLHREELSHHHPRDGTEAHGEGHDEQDEADERDPTEGSDVVAIFLHLEVDAKDDEAKTHDARTLEEQDPTTSFVDEDRREVSSNGLDDSYDDGGDDGRDVGASRLEDVVRVEDDGVDATELLEEHEAEPTDERHARSLCC